MLGRIQNDLFDVGSDLATPGRDPAGTAPSLRVTAEQSGWLEQMIDHYNEGLAPLTSFVLPGGNALSAALHLARTIVRRAERLVVELVLTEPDLNNQTIIYLNRLSDLMFVLGRVANSGGRNDVLWKPGRFGHDATQPKPGDDSEMGR
jgi:cob(I)alamin adenosyltransferase